MTVIPRVTAFGLDLFADRPLTFLQCGGTAATGRRLALSVAPAAADLGWTEQAKLISDERGSGGEVVFQIEQDGEDYRIFGPRYGETVLAADGRAARGAPGSGGDETWERMLIAQVLPFAALLRGLEVLHASAVTVDGQGVGFLGHSGAGKTSVAFAMCRLGAAFLADDVLAVERRDGRLLAHPGSPVAALDRGEAKRLCDRGWLDREAVVREDERETIVRVEPGPPAPLTALFVLDRRPDGPGRPRFEPVAEPAILLSSTFNLLVEEPARLETLLDVCSIAAAGRVERVVAGPGVDATALAAEIAGRLGEKR
jgi:hypothetical protein